MRGYSIRHKGDTRLNLELHNPIIPSREIIIETDTNRIKIGDGIKQYKDLPYLMGAGESTVNVASDDGLVHKTQADVSPDVMTDGNTWICTLTGRKYTSIQGTWVEF